MLQYLPWSSWILLSSKSLIAIRDRKNTKDGAVKLHLIEMISSFPIRKTVVFRLKIPFLAFKLVENKDLALVLMAYLCCLT